MIGWNLPERVHKGQLRKAEMEVCREAAGRLLCVLEKTTSIGFPRAGYVRGQRQGGFIIKRREVALEEARRAMTASV